jgi:hypothetical protein
MGAYEFQAPYVPIATQLTFTQLPSKPVVNTAISPIVVSIEEQGNASTSDDAAVTLSIQSGPAAGTLAGTLTSTATNGVATFGSLTLSAVGTYALLATDSADNLTMVSTPFVVSAGAPAKLVFVKQPPVSLVAGSTPTIKVDIEDQYGNIVTTNNGKVTLSPFSTYPPTQSTESSDLSTAQESLSPLDFDTINLTGPYPFGPSVTVRAVNGVATFSNAMTMAGSLLSLQASHGTLPVISSNTFTVTPAAASKLVLNVVTYPSYSADITVEDAFGNTITSANGKATLSLLSPLGTTFPNGKTTKTVQLSSGQGSVALNFPNSARYTLQATHGTLPAAQSSFLYTVPGSSFLVFAQSNQPTTAEAGTPLTPDVVVKIKDSFGFLDTTADGKVTLSIASGPAGATLGGITTVNAVDGIATFDDISFLEPGDYTLKATHGSLPASISEVIDVTPKAG